MSQGHYIALSHHRLMLIDDLRMASFEAAIKKVVKPGDVVVDVGTGTGVLALFAARAGARRVFAIEPMPIIGIARRLAQDNAGGDCIEFIEADAREVTLPELADVVISECMGNFFITDDLAPVIRDARRFLKPGGRVVPEGISLHVAPAFYPLLDDITFWDTPVYGLDLSGAREHALQTTYVRHVDPRMLMAPPQEPLRFHTLDAPDRVHGELAFTIRRPCTIHALVGWFDASLAPGVNLSTAPGENTHWAQLLFPIEPISVPAGCRLEARFDLAMDEDYRTRWRWSAHATDAGESLAVSRHDTQRRFQ